MLPWKLKQPYYRQPPGGWHLPRDGTIHRADTPEKLEEIVRQHMLQNGKAPGNIADEIVMFTHTSWPHLTEMNVDYVSSDTKPARTASDVLRDVFEWMGRMALQGQEEPPDRHVIAARTARCLTCPHHAPYKPDDPLYEDIRRKAFMLTKGRLPDKLGYCTRWALDCRVACQWQEQLLGRPDASVPECWRT
jgi:hypothetical protein